MDNRRAVSNTLGFVLLFGIVFASIVAVNTVGLGALQEGRDTTIAQNAALSMESLSDAIEELREENGTTRLSVIRGGGGSIGPGESTTITISLDGTTVYDQTSKPIVYRLDEARIVYEAGALIRTQENGGAILIDGPAYEFDNDIALFPVTKTTSVDGETISGQTVTTYLEQVKSSLLEHRTSYSNTITYRIQTSPQRVQVWHKMMDGMAAGDPCSVSGADTVECTYNTGGSSLTVIIRDVHVTYEFVT